MTQHIHVASGPEPRVTDRPAAYDAPTQPAGQKDSVPLAWVMAVLLRDRRTVLAFAAAGVLLGVVIGLIRPPMYTASFSFIPQTTQDQARGGLAALAGQLGLPLGLAGGGSQPPQLYAELVSTRELLLRIARDSFPVSGRQAVPLPEFLDVTGGNPRIVEEQTVRQLREKVVSSSVATRTSGAVTVKVRTRSPQVSYGIATRLLEELNRFNLSTRQSQAGAERRFTEARLEAARASLREAEDDLQRFLQGNRQYQNSPQLTFEYERRQREVGLRQQVMQGLSEQYEDARIREVRDTPVITVIESPALPALPDPRGRIRMLVVLTFLLTVTGCGFVLGREGWRRQQRLSADPAYAMLHAEWQRIRKLFRKS